MSDHDKRVHHHMYETNECIWEHAERIAKLEEMVLELYEDQCDECDQWKYRDRMHELGIEMDA